MIVKQFTEAHLADAQQKRQDAQGAATSALLEVISGLVAQQKQEQPQEQPQTPVGSTESDGTVTEEVVADAAAADTPATKQSKGTKAK